MGKVSALKFEGKRYDLGDPLGFLVSSLEIGLKRPELRLNLLYEIRKILSNYETQN